MKRLALPLGGCVLAAACLAVEYHSGGHARAALAALLAGVAATCWGIAQPGRPWLRVAGAVLLPAAAAAAISAAMDPALKVWAVPAQPLDLLRLSDVGAVTAAAILLLATAANLLGRRPPRPWVTTAAALALPVLFNLLLALAAPALMARLGNALSLHRCPGLAPQIGRAAALWLFCEALVVGLGLLMDGRRPRGWRLHALAAGAAALAAVTPWLADLASGARPAALPVPLRLGATVLGAALSEAGLWALTFLATGMILDALHQRRPTWRSASAHWRGGLGKGLVYGGVFMLLIGLAAQAAALPWLAVALSKQTLAASAVLGALLFPLARTLVESFDGSAPFAARLWAAARTPANYLRGAIAGAGIGLALAHGMPGIASAARFGIGFAIGAAAYAGADLLLDALAIVRRRRQRLQGARIYLLGALVGGFVGGALAWYFDAVQLAVVLDKFWRYAAVDLAAGGAKPGDFVVYPLFSKWGAVNLGAAGGGVSLLYSESLAGVINWSIAAPLFSVNLVLLTALLQRRLQPLREMISRQGLTTLVEQTVRVLRWGPWMAPIISSFLRQAPQPSWYNQDGAVRSAVAVVQNWRLDGAAFRQWSRDVFLGLLAYDWLRILIWFDHMGLRVATLVNLSFVGADALDERAARFAGHAGRTRVIPEGVRRFLTWAPLLIPFYIPRGGDWDYVWSGAEQMQKAPPPLLPAVSTLLGGYALAALLALAAGAVTTRALARSARRRAGRPVRPAPLQLGNGHYWLELAADGRGYSRTESLLRPGSLLDLSRRPEDPAQLRGKFFYLRELDAAQRPLGEAWSLGAEPLRRTGPDYALTQPVPGELALVNTWAGIRAQARLSVHPVDAVERWDIRLTNLEARPRRIELTSYQELAIGPVDGYRRTPPFAALHLGTCFVRGLGAILAHNRLLRDAGSDPALPHGSPEVAFHAAGTAQARLAGYEDSRARFIGCGDLRAPDALLRPGADAVRAVDDEGALYTFDPVASLRLVVELPPGASLSLPFVDGYARDAQAAAALIARHLQLQPLPAAAIDAVCRRTRVLLDGDAGEPIAAAAAVGADQAEIVADARAARPWTHVLANPLGQGAVLGADGEVFSFFGNAQQNALSPFRLESLPTQLPGQGCFVLDLESGECLSPAYAALRRAQDRHQARFGRGYAVFGAEGAGLALELTVTVPLDAPVELRHLKITNRSARARRLRVAHHCDMVLAETAHDSRGVIDTRVEDDGAVLLFSNPANDFVRGWTAAATSLVRPAQATVRSRFVGAAAGAGAGAGADWALPHFVRHGGEDPGIADDGLRTAAFAGTLELPANGELEVVFVLAQAPAPGPAASLARRYLPAAAAAHAQLATRQAWDRQLGGLRIDTDQPEFDRMVNDWLPYQVLTARLWGRAGPGQRSGAYGFRDQLQDVLPLVFVQPGVARAQILLHAAHQFLDGDVPKWWHPVPDGGTGICVRTAASDPQLWLPYVATRYVDATGDSGLFDQVCAFLEGPPLPSCCEGIMFVPRPTRDRADVYEHCHRAVEWSLARTGAHGLPLLGSGDWNDGIDAAGIGGRGESTWMAMFLRRVLLDFAAHARRREGAAAAERYLQEAERLRLALEPFRRDGGRYVRATDDAGAELSYADALTGAWPALAAAVPWRAALQTLESCLRELEKDQRVLLLAPPFDQGSRPYPGRIAEYPPGVRENGGQYSHGASWLVDALLHCAQAAAAEGDAGAATACRLRAWEIWWKISPLSKFGGDGAGRYGLSPHQQPADVYEGPAHGGRGGWSWYTGAAARMLSAAYALLGVELHGGRLQIAAGMGTADGAPRLQRLRFRGQDVPLGS